MRKEREISVKCRLRDKRELREEIRPIVYSCGTKRVVYAFFYILIAKIYPTFFENLTYNPIILCNIYIEIF